MVLITRFKTRTQLGIPLIRSTTAGDYIAAKHLLWDPFATLFYHLTLLYMGGGHNGPPWAKSGTPIGWQFQFTLIFDSSFCFGPKNDIEQAEKLKSREMREWWMKNDEGWWRMNEEWWMMKDEGWWFHVEGFCFQMDERMDGLTFVIVESLLRLTKMYSF